VAHGHEAPVAHASAPPAAQNPTNPDARAPNAAAAHAAKSDAHAGQDAKGEGDDEADDADGEGLSPEDAAAFDAAALDPKRLAEVLRAQLEKVRDKVLTKMEEKIDAKTEKKLDAFRTFMGYFSLAGLLLLFVPLFLMRKYPGKLGVLFKYSALAAVSFVVCVNLFTGVAAIMKGAQGATGKFTNPQIAITTAVFDSLHESRRASR
jgi:hypothetical protein